MGLIFRKTMHLTLCNTLGSFSMNIDIYSKKNSPRLEILLPDPVETFRRVETFRGTYSDVTSHPFVQQTPNSRRDRSD